MGPSPSIESDRGLRRAEALRTREVLACRGTTMSIRFRWDPAKDATNIAKHRVGFDEACTVFADPLARIFPDDDHSKSEAREIIVGHCRRGRLLLVFFTERPDGVRIFSARLSTRQERRDHEENAQA